MKIAGCTAPLVQASDGTFYGTATGGGANFYGTVFKVTTNGTLTRLWSFTGGNDGSYPERAGPGQRYQLQYSSDLMNWIGLGGPLSVGARFVPNRSEWPEKGALRFAGR